MAENKKSVLLYCDLIHTVEKLTNTQAGKLFKHYLRYINDLNPDADDVLIDLVFEPIKQNLKRDLKKWEQTKEGRSLAGKASAEARRLKKEAQKTSTNSTNVNFVQQIQQSSTNPTVTVTVNDTVKDISTIYEKFVDDVKSGKFNSRVESIYMRLKLKENSLTPLLKDFKLNVIERQTKHKDTNDFFINFVNWLNVQDRNQLLDKYKK